MMFAAIRTEVSDRWYLAILLAAGMVLAAPAFAADTGIEGMVLWGPVKPGPSKHGEDDEAPLRASFTVYAGEDRAARFESDKFGAFRVSLPPGDYTIVPDEKTPVPYPTKQVTRVSVPYDGYASITIRLDTGMR